MPAQPGPRSDQIQPDGNPGDIMTIGPNGKPAFTSSDEFVKSSELAGEHAPLDHTGLPGVGNLYDGAGPTGTVDHGTVNHTGLPGVGNLYDGAGPTGTVDHGAVDHTGVDGVGNLYSGDVTSQPAGTVDHAGLDHAGVAGVGNLYNGVGPAGTTDHSALDHASIPGVPTEYYKVLDNTATLADINTAINTSGIQTVFLRPGTYNLTTYTKVSIPSGKSLIGLATQAPNSTTALQPVLECSFSFSDNIFQSGFGVEIKNLLVRRTGGTWSGSTSSIFSLVGNANSHIKVENVEVRDFSSGSPSGSVNSVFRVTGGFDLKQLIVRNCSAPTSGAGINLTNTTGFPNNSVAAPSSIENCLVTGFGSGSSSAGIRFSGNITRISNCISRLNAGDGFNLSFTEGLMFQNNNANNNGGDGVRQVTSTGRGNVLHGNSSYGNTGQGFNLMTVTPSDTSFFHLNYYTTAGAITEPNLGGNTIAGNWSLSNNQQNAN